MKPVRTMPSIWHFIQTFLCHPIGYIFLLAKKTPNYNNVYFPYYCYWLLLLLWFLFIFVFSYGFLYQTSKHKICLHSSRFSTSACQSASGWKCATYQHSPSNAIVVFLRVFSLLDPLVILQRYQRFWFPPHTSCPSLYFSFNLV